jgi:hypothetical protein
MEYGYDFGVVREPLSRKDKTDTQYDALYREEDGKQLSVVSRDYQLVTHKEAMEFVFNELDDMRLPFETKRIGLTNQGKRMLYEIEFPMEEFDIPGDESKGTPTLLVTNSIDRSKSFTLGFGTYRLICTNGMIIGERLFNVAETHYRENIKFAEIGPFVKSGIEQVRTVVTRTADRLLAESALEYFRTVVEKMPTAFVAMTTEQVQKLFSWESVMRGGIEVPKPETIEQIDKAYTAYELLQVLTFVASHQITSALKRQKVDAQISRLMGVR